MQARRWRGAGHAIARDDRQATRTPAARAPAARLDGADVAMEFTRPDAAAAQRRAPARGRRPGRVRHDRLAGPAPAHSRRWSGARGARCSTPPTSPSACTSCSAPPGPGPALRGAPRVRRLHRRGASRRQARRAVRHRAASSSARHRRGCRPRPFPITSVRAGAIARHSPLALRRALRDASRWRTWRGAARGSRRAPARGRVAAGTPRRLHVRGHALRGAADDTPSRDAAPRWSRRSPTSGAVDCRGAAARWSSGRSRRGSTSSCPAAPPARRRRWTTASASGSSRRCVEAAAGRVPVMAGATSNDTRRAVDETRRMCGLGVDGILTRHALLQQAHAGRPRAATSSPSPTRPPARSASTTSPAAPRVNILPDHRARAGRAPERRRHQGGERRPAARSWRSSAGRPDGFAVLSGDDWLALADRRGGGDGLISVIVERGAGAR